MELSPKAIVAGRYRAEQRLGSGAMGEVWTGVHLAVGVKVAIKRLLPAGTHNHESLARFKREAQLLGRVNSEYVARVVDFVEDPQYGLVLVMELVEGRSLYDLLNQRRFSIEEALDLGCDILTGLCDLHEAQIVHRDLKPGNIIVEERTRGRLRARIVDFGMSRVIRGGGDDEEEMTGITRADVALGTLEYMAPEQMLNSRGVTGAADVYAAGVILFRAVAGHHAYRSESDGGLVRAKLTMDAPPLPSGRDDALANEFAAIVAKSLRRKPNERYTTAEEMLYDLEQLRGSKGQRPAEPSIRVEVSRSMAIAEEGTPAGSAVFSPASALANRPTHAEESQLMPIPLARAPSRPSLAPSASSSSTPRRVGLVIAAVVGGIAVGALAMYAGQVFLTSRAASSVPSSSPLRFAGRCPTAGGVVPSPAMRTRVILALAAVVLPVAVLGACSKETTKPTPEAHGEGHEQVKEAFGSLTIEQVEAKIAEAKAGKLTLALVDNNTKERFEKSHLPGARWVKFSEVAASDLPADKDATLVFYCSNDH